jgi:hypothetical protein
MSTLVEELCRITPQRPLSEVAKDCDVVFSDGAVPIEIDSQIVADSFEEALTCARENGKVALAVFGSHFTVVWPDARWMRALRLYQSLRDTT